MASSSADGLFCGFCNVHTANNLSMQLHVESKNHLKKVESQSEFMFNEDEIYVDEDSKLARLIATCKAPLLGGEEIVEDKTANCAKCLLCRTIIKDLTAVTDHMRTAKHQQLYLETHHGQLLKDAQTQSQRDGTKFGQMINRLVADISRQCGRQPSKIHEKGVVERYRKFFESGGKVTGSAVELHFLKKLGLSAAGEDVRHVEQRRSRGNSVGMEIAEDPDDEGLDVFEELPTAPDVMYTLLTAEMVSMGKGKAAIERELRAIEEPVVGLEFIAEYLDFMEEFEPGYLCTLCESRLSPKQCLAHVISERHRLKFLETKSPEKFTVLSFKALSDRRQEMLMKHLVEIEETERRGSITLRLVLPQEARDSVFALHRRIKNSSRHRGDHSEETHNRKDRRRKEFERNDREHYGRHRSGEREEERRGRKRHGSDDRHRDSRHNSQSRSSRDRHSRESSRREQRRSKSPSYVSRHSDRLESSVGERHERLGQFFYDGDQYDSAGYHHDYIDDRYQMEPTEIIREDQWANAYPPHMPIEDYNSTFDGGQNYYQYDPMPVSSAIPPSRNYFRGGTGQESTGFSTDDIEFKPAGSMKRFQTAAKAVLRPKSPGLGKSPKMEKPTFIYSEKEEQNRKLRELENRLPAGCDRNVKSGWFSVRQYSIDFLERIAQPDGKTEGAKVPSYFSFRSPNARTDFYGDWNADLLRRIQDKFSFKLNHMMWLKTLITDHNIPTDVPLTLSHLDPLKEEVETAVLNELIGAVLVPSADQAKLVFSLIDHQPESPNRVVVVEPEKKVIDYCPPQPQFVPPQFSVPPPMVPSQPSSISLPSGVQLSSAQLNSFSAELLSSLAGLTNLTPKSTNLSAGMSAPVKTEVPLIDLVMEDSSQEAKAAVEQKSREAAISQLVEQIIVTAKQNDQRNPVLKMLLSFANPKAILFQLATKQPQTLQQFISVMRNPKLNIPEELLKDLHVKLTTLAEQAELSQIIPAKKVEEDCNPSTSSVKAIETLEPSKRSESHSHRKRGRHEDTKEDEKKKRLKKLEISERVEHFRKLKSTAGATERKSSADSASADNNTSNLSESSSIGLVQSSTAPVAPGYYPEVFYPNGPGGMGSFGPELQIPYQYPPPPMLNYGGVVYMGGGFMPPFQ